LLISELILHAHIAPLFYFFLLLLCIVMLFGAMDGQLWWALAFLATHHCI